MADITQAGCDLASWRTANASRSEGRWSRSTWTSTGSATGQPPVRAPMSLKATPGTPDSLWRARSSVRPRRRRSRLCSVMPRSFSLVRTASAKTRSAMGVPRALPFALR